MPFVRGTEYVAAIERRGVVHQECDVIKTVEGAFRQLVDVGRRGHIDLHRQHIRSTTRCERAESPLSLAQSVIIQVCDTNSHPKRYQAFSGGESDPTGTTRDYRPAAPCENIGISHDLTPRYRSGGNSC